MVRFLPQHTRQLIIWIGGRLELEKWVMSNSPTSESSPEMPEQQPLAAESAANRSTKARQLLGMKGAQAGETNIWKIRLQLMKPITWIPLIWGVLCGAASSGGYVWNLENFTIAALCMLMSGPLLAGYTQTLNDFYRSRDRCH